MNNKHSKLILATLLGLTVLPSCTSEYDPVKESRSRAFDIVVIRRPVVAAPAPAPAPAPVVTPKPVAPVVVKSTPLVPIQPAPQQVAAPLPVAKTTTQAASVSPRQQAPKKVVSTPAAPLVVPKQAAPQRVVAPSPVVRTTTQAASISPKQESPKKQVTAPTSSATRQVYVNQYGQQVVKPVDKTAIDYPVMPSRTHGGRGNSY